MTRPTERNALAETLRRIEALECIVPSDLDPEDQWKRNGEYVYLDDVKKIIADEAKNLPANPRRRGLLDLLFGEQVEKVKLCHCNSCCCGSINPGSHVLRCEKCSKQFCWGILYGVTCPHCGYCAEEEDNAVDQSV